MIEDVLRSIKAAIVANLTTRQTAETTAAAAKSYPTVTLRAIPTGQIHICDPTGQTAQFQSLPAIVLVAANTGAEPWASQHEGFGRKDCDHNVWVSVWCDSQDPETGTTELLRTARALEIVLERDIAQETHTAGVGTDAIIMVTVDRIDWYDFGPVGGGSASLVAASLNVVVRERVASFSGSP